VLPYRGLPPLAWNAAVNATVLAGAAVGTRLFEDPVRTANLRLRRPRVDVLLAALGLPLGLVGSVVLHPSPLVQGGGAGAIVAEVVVLLGLAAVAEELLFRGLLLSASRDVLTSNREATLYGAGVAAALYLGTASLGYIALMALAAAGLAEARWRGASLWGLTACRGAALVVMALLAR
jgi:membrane protease YdiL (CAAX protease family)